MEANVQLLEKDNYMMRILLIIISTIVSLNTFSAELDGIKFDDKVKVETRFGTKECEKILYNGKVPVIEIETEDGNVVTCSHNHRFLCQRNGEEVWVRADELTEDDEIIKG